MASSTTTDVSMGHARHEVIRYEIVGEDVFVDLRPTHTILDLMSIVCETWLSAARGGDGDVFAHLWEVSSNLGMHTGPHEAPPMLAEFSGTPETRKKSTPLAALGGGTLGVRYDFGDTTEFKLRPKRVAVSEEEAALCPREYSVGGLQDAYLPPEGTPSVDEVFPLASKFLFGEGSIAQWVLMGRLRTCCGAVEAGPNAMGDLVFCPNRFGSVHEFMVALEEAAKMQPPDGVRSDAFSRMVFPLNMRKKDEDKFRMFQEDLEGHQARVAEAERHGPIRLGSSRLSEADSYRMCGPQECVVRVEKEALEESMRKMDFKAAFPATSAAFEHKDYRWMSYRRGTMLVCMGKDGEGSERGIPKPSGVLAKGKKKVNSLHEFFCLAEALWESVV